MNNIAVLDCTLRDGGYCNHWDFGENNIHKIIGGLVAANVDIIECGFITERVTYKNDISKYTHVNHLDSFIPKIGTNQLFVAMINFGEFNIDKLPKCESSRLDGIRVAFHKNDVCGAIDYCRKVKEKGYKLFVQPMVSMSYSDSEFQDLIRMVNEIEPYAFYIVDSFGAMRKRTLLHYYHITEKSLNRNVAIGFHSHNNFQSAYSNATCILEQEHNHSIIIDASVYGMGRGAGNLNTELLLNELNTEYGMHYLIKPILQMMDDVINRFYAIKPWGYSLPNYLSASYMIHPNYAQYLCEKNTLTVDAIDDIFSLMDVKKSVEFDASYIEGIYENYMSRSKEISNNINEFKSLISQRKILLVAPGKSSDTEKDEIQEFVKKENPIVISINHEYEWVKVDYIFVSNIRRYQELSECSRGRAIVTTNIEADNAYMKTDYFSLLNSSNIVKDNAGLMAIKFLKNLECDKVYLAGYDGYEYDAEKNYENRNLELIMSKEQIDNLNKGMKMVLHEMQNEISIEFLTTSRFA